MKPKVLVVDDDVANADTLCEVLAMAGLEPLFALGGAEGLAVFLKERPNLVVSDARMPGIDGHAMVRAIRAAPGGSEVPVILMSGTHPVLDDPRFCEVYLLKPFRGEDLLREVDRLLSAGRRTDRMHESRAEP